MVHLKSTFATISSFDYRYDPTGRRTVVMEASGERVSWVYDAAGQLQRQHRDGVPGYDATHLYDPAGNRRAKIDSGDPTTFSYHNANRLLYSEDGAGRTTFAYDAAGNQRSEEKPSGDITTSLWDGDNRNTAVELPGGDRVTMLYTAAGQRVRRETFDETKVFLFDAQNILAEYDGAGFPQSAFTLEPREFGNVISQYRQEGALWAAAYYHFDALGSTDSLTDSIEVVTDSYQYTAYGDLKSSSGTSVNLFTWVGELGYVRDSDTGEYNLRARQYQPGQARFKSEDPLGQEPDANVYRYVENDPANRVDPSGEEETPNFPCKTELNNLNSLEGWRNTLKDELEGLATQRQQLEDKLRRLRDSKKQKEARNALDQEDRDRLEKVRDWYTRAINRWEDELAEYSLNGSKLKDLRKERAQLLRDLRQAAARYYRNRGNIGILQQIASIRAQIAQKTEQIRTRGRSAALKAAIASAWDRVEALQEHIDELDSATSKRESEIASLKSQIFVAQTLLDVFLFMYETRMKELQGQVDWANELTQSAQKSYESCVRDAFRPKCAAQPSARARKYDRSGLKKLLADQETPGTTLTLVQEGEDCIIHVEQTPITLPIPYYNLELNAGKTLYSVRFKCDDPEERDQALQFVSRYRILGGLGHVKFHVQAGRVVVEEVVKEATGIDVVTDAVDLYGALKECENTEDYAKASFFFFFTWGSSRKAKKRCDGPDGPKPDGPNPDGPRPDGPHPGGPHNNGPDRPDTDGAPKPPESDGPDKTPEGAPAKTGDTPPGSQAKSPDCECETPDQTKTGNASKKSQPPNQAGNTPKTPKTRDQLTKEDFSNAGKVIDRGEKGNELTKAGRGLQKHRKGGRKDSKDKFPDPKGPNKEINRLGQEQLDDILNDPGTIRIDMDGGGVEFRAPDGRGVRFNADGSWFGFMD